jgi:NMD protein affecting ribosome stability and mRNA decay
VHEHERLEIHPLLCPQCGSPSDGSPTISGMRSSFCEDCVADREIGDVLSFELG